LVGGDRLPPVLIGSEWRSMVPEEFFADVSGPIGFAGPDSNADLAFRVYDPERMVLGKRMEDQLRIAV
jgi:xylose isomerase